jgi:lipoprotein-releasing system ATP-binding protein
MLLQLKHLSKAYGQKGSDKYQIVLDDVSLEIERGQRIAVTGPSGSGKTTLLNMAGSLDKPDQGQVLYMDRDITGLTGRGLEQFRNQAVGFVFQQHHLLPQFSQTGTQRKPGQGRKTLSKGQASGITGIRSPVNYPAVNPSVLQS